MKLDKRRFEIARARKSISLQTLSQTAYCSHNTIRKRLKEDIDPCIIGRIAEALEVDVTEIIAD